MNSNTLRSAGFTLLEIMVTIAIIAVLAVVGVGFYGKYLSRAQGSEIAVKYDAIRTGVRTNIAEGSSADCAAVESKFDTRNLAEQYSSLSYGFEAVPGGFRPVLSVCATAGKHGEAGVRATRAAHDDFAKNGVVEKGAVVSDSVVSFALRLTAGDAAVCTTYTKATAGDCAGNGSQTVAPVVCTPDTDKVVMFLSSGNKREFCAAKCPQGTVRSQDPAHPMQCVAIAEPVVPNKPSSLVCGPAKEVASMQRPDGTTQEICLPSCPEGTTRSQDPARLTTCIGQSTPVAGTCPADSEKFAMPTSSGTTKDICLPKCPSGKTRISDPNRGLICAGPSPQAGGCPADQEAIAFPRGDGTTKNVCMVKCPAGKTRSSNPAEGLTCV